MQKKVFFEKTTLARVRLTRDCCIIEFFLGKNLKKVVFLQAIIRFGTID